MVYASLLGKSLFLAFGKGFLGFCKYSPLPSQPPLSLSNPPYLTLCRREGGERKFLTQNIFQAQFFLDPHFFRTHNIFGHKIFWTQNFSGPKIFLDPKFF